jgi:hypothetical protein
MTEAPETAALVSRLMSMAVPGRGLPYYKGNGPSAEPTLLALLALSAVGASPGLAKPLLSWTAGLQNDDGSVGIDPAHRDQGLWLTSASAIVFHRYALKEARDRAREFILALKSVTVANDPRIRQDNTLTGWPWVPGTFGWVEPTAWSVIALNVCGSADDPRAVEGRKFLLDREIPSGGWNYGNPAINDRELLPFWDTTGLALVALRGRAEAGLVQASLELLEKEQGRIDSLCGLSWASLGLDAHKRNSARLKQKLYAVMSSVPDEELNAAHFAAGLVALSGKDVFLP